MNVNENRKNKLTNNENVNSNRQENKSKLYLIPKMENYIDYMLDFLHRMPKEQKYISENYGKSMFNALNKIFVLNSGIVEKRISLVEEIDMELNFQRACLRIIKKKGYIESRKCDVALEKVNEIGKIIGGLNKYYNESLREEKNIAKDN